MVLHDQRERKELILSREIEEADKGGSTEAETETTSSLFIFQVDTFIAELTVEKVALVSHQSALRQERSQACLRSAVGL